jgi:glutathione S-transferase
MTLTLYYSPVSCSLVPYIALTEAGAAFDVRPINLLEGGHRTEEFRRINPKQAVPVLVVDGSVLTENVALLVWIARRFPDARLLPADPMQEIKALSFLAWCSSGIHPRLTPNALPQRYCDLPGSEESVRRCAQTLLRSSYAVAEESLADGRDWFFHSFGAPDIYFFWCFRRGGQFGLDQSEFVRCSAHFERMRERPSVQRLLAFEAEVIRGFAAH